jgi:mRNA interferase RelE/StbE
MNEPQRHWKIVIDRQPQKEMRRLPGDIRQRIDRVILALTEDPRPAGCKSVRDAPRVTYRVRVGAYRVIYTVLDAEGVIVVARVRKRDESTYRGL